MQKDTISLEEMYAIVKNNHSFYQFFETLQQQILPSIFKADYKHHKNTAEIAFCSCFNFLSYSMEEMALARLGDKLRGCLSRELKDTEFTFNYSEISELSKLLMQEAITEIQLGNVELDYDIRVILTQRYIGKSSKKQTAADNGISTYKLNKILDKYTEDFYRRYNRVQNGERYAVVMGDCEPYIQNQPQFNPIIYSSWNGNIQFLFLFFNSTTMTEEAWVL